MSNNYLTSNTSITSLVNAGNTTFNNSYSGFPSCTSTSNNWENPTALGYQINNIDIANGVQAVHTNYIYSPGTSVGIPVLVNTPSWCNALKIIAIAGGGGGGSGGANNNDRRGGCGGSGAGAGMGILYFKSFNDGFVTHTPQDTIVNITVNPVGLGGGYQENPGDPGYWGSQGGNIAINIITTRNPVDYIMNVNGGGGGAAGQGTSGGNESVGGQNTSISTGNSTTTPGTAPSISNSANFNCNFNAGNSGGGGGNHVVGNAGIITNFNSNNEPPTLNQNQGQPPQGNNLEINNANEKPGYGQGGVGGWNSDNNNGYPGQNGGAGLVRVYFLK